MYRIFIVEDDKTIAGQVEKALSAWGFQCRCATVFSDILPEVQAFDPHLVLLDIMLPFYNGYHWCEKLRQTSRVPILFLSSASDNMNIVMAINMGGDDFVAKPFDMAVLVAKVQALLRRSYDFVRSDGLVHRGLVLDPGDSSFMLGDEKTNLTKNECRILATLLESKGKIVSREKLMLRLWETDSFVDDNTLTVNINRLRKKLESAGLSDFITTRHGQGYVVE